MKTENILIVKLGAIGDVAMTLPIIDKLKEKKQCHITWLCGHSASPLLKRYDKIDRIIEISHQKLIEGSIYEKLKELFFAWRFLAFKKYSLVLTLHKDKRYKLLSLFTYKNIHKFFSPKDEFPLGKSFHTESYLNLINEKFFTFSDFKKIKTDNKREKKTIIISPGGILNDNEKMNRVWPLELYVELTKYLIKQKFNVIVVGDKSHEVFSDKFTRIGALSKIGQTSLDELLDMLSKVYLLITHDCGVFHLARLCGCKRLGIFGPTNPQNFTNFRDDNEKVIYSGDHLPCRPCYDGKRYAQCSHKKCLSSIKPKIVILLLKTWLNLQHEN